MAPKKATKTVVHQINSIAFHIRGETPLICHKFSEKAKQEMLAKQMKKKTTGKAAKDPEADYLGSLYPLSSGKGYGFPAVAFKAAAVRASKALDKTMVDMRCAIYVKPQNGDLVEIKGEPEPREDVVRLQNGVCDIRYRAQFPKWSAKIEFEYDPNVVGEDELLAIFSRAGKFVGVGDWRSERNGTFGTWTVAKVEVSK